jgi:hypothetical protein
LGCEGPQYTAGTYYYVGGDLFLFFLSHLLKFSSEVRQRLEPMFKERVQERFGVEADSLSLAARIIAAVTVDIVVDRQDVESLLSMLMGKPVVFQNSRNGNTNLQRWHNDCPSRSRYPTGRVQTYKATRPINKLW